MIDALAQGLTFLPLQFARNIIDYTIPAADINLTSRTDVRYLVELQKPTYWGSTSWESVRVFEGREKPPYTTLGTQIYEGARFVINRGRNGLLDSLLSYTKPASGQKNMRAVVSQTLQFQLITQTLGGTPAQNLSSTLAPMYAIKAGLSSEDFANHSDTFWTDYQSKNRKFLTWRPNNQRVAWGQEEYLHFVINFSPTPTELRLRVQFKNYGEEPTEAVTVVSLTNVPQYAIVSVPVSPSVVEMDTQYDYYDVWLSNQNNERISEVRTYQLDKTYEAFERGILFANSLGGWDTLRCTGRATQTLGVNQGAARREKTKRNDIEFSDLLIVNTEGGRSVTVSTGFFRRDAAEHVLWLSELLLSEACYWMTPKGHLPVQITTNSLVEAEDDVNLVARTITFKVLDTVENYSALPANVVVPVRPTIWVGSNITYLRNEFGLRTGMASYATLRKVYANTLELTFPYEIKPNVAGDPDYIAPFVDESIIPGSTPFPNAAINRALNFTKNNCSSNYVGNTVYVIVEAGKYGGEVSGEADILAEAEFASKNNQEYANTYGACIIQYRSAAISRLSTFTKNNCPGGDSGSRWTISVLEGAYQSIISQADADAQANAYANVLDTQANANANGGCVAGQLYSVIVPSGSANYRFYFASHGGYIAWAGGQSGYIPSDVTTDILMNSTQRNQTTTVYGLHSAAFSKIAYVYKNGVLWFQQAINYTTPGSAQNLFNIPATSDQDLIYIKTV